MANHGHSKPQRLLEPASDLPTLYIANFDCLLDHSLSVHSFDILARLCNLAMAKKQAARVHFPPGTGSSPEDMHLDNVLTEDLAELKGAGQSTKGDQELDSQGDHCMKEKQLQDRIHWLEQRVIKLQLKNQSLTANAEQSPFLRESPFMYMGTHPAKPKTKEPKASKGKELGVLKNPSTSSTAPKLSDKSAVGLDSEAVLTRSPPAGIDLDLNPSESNQVTSGTHWRAITENIEVVIWRYEYLNCTVDDYRRYEQVTVFQINP